MKPIVIHPISALAGAAFLALALLAAGAWQAPAHAAQRMLTCFPPGPLHVAGIPDPRDLIAVREEDGPYSLPAGRRFIVLWAWSEGTFAEGSNASAPVALNDSGATTVFNTPVPYVYNSGRAFLDGPRTFSVSSEGNGRLVGYLVPN